MGFLKKTAGYTFAELIMAFGIFATFLTASGTVGINFYNAQQKERARNLVLEETQFLLNRISNLIRENTIDYAEYYSNGCADLSDPGAASYCLQWENTDGDVNTLDPIYGDDMGEDFREDPDNVGAAGGYLSGEYDRRFYSLPSCDLGDRHGDANAYGLLCDYNDPNNYDEGSFNTGADNSVLTAPYGNDNPDRNALVPPPAGVTNIQGYEQKELYLISADGTKKTIIRRIANGMDDDHDGAVDEDAGNLSVADGDGNELLGIGEMFALDYANNNDGYLDGYRTIDDFDTDGNGVLDISDFIPIVPSQIEVVDISFFIAPLDDPRKAYTENELNVQIQPHVTILLQVRPSDRLARTLVGQDFEVSIQTTVTSRVLNEVNFPSS